MILIGQYGISPRSHLADLGLEQAVVDVAGVALGAGHGDQRAVVQRLGRVAAADHRRDAEFARDDRRVAGAAAAVGDDGAGALHHRLPVRVGHVGDQHVAGLHLVHLGECCAPGAPGRCRSSGRSRGPRRAPCSCPVALELVALLDLALGLALHRLGPRLQDVELAVDAVLAPLDVHRPAVVLLDDQRVAAPARPRRRRSASSGCAARAGCRPSCTSLPLAAFSAAEANSMPDQLGAEVAADDRRACRRAAPACGRRTRPGSPRPAPPSRPGRSSR